MKKPLRSIMMLILFIPLFSLQQASGIENADLSKYLQDVPFAMGEIALSVFPDKDVNIINFGAVGDGHTMNTESINKSIQECAASGGGRVVIPAGIWLTGPIQLHSNVNLYLEMNALLLFSGMIDDYKLVRSNYEGEDQVRYESPISGINVENVAITGDGLIDGSGDAWRPVKKMKLTEQQWKTLLASGGVVNKNKDTWWPSEAALKGEATVRKLTQNGKATLDQFRAAGAYLRPVMIRLVGCKNVLLDGPTFQNSPSWNIHPLLCENLVIRNITVRNPWYSQNGDGIDIESCRNLLLYNSTFDVGDDAICMKSGRDEAGRKRGRPSEQIVIANCTVYHGHGGFTIGSEMSGGVKHVLVRNCTFIGTDVGLRFKSNRGRGGVIENIFIQDILMKDIPTDAIRFNMYYNNAEPLLASDEPATTEVPPVTDETPLFRKIYISNVICRGAERAIFLQGLPEMAINQIEFTNVNISANKGMVGVDAERITLNNVNLQPECGPAFHFINSKEIMIEKLDDLPRLAIMLKLEGKTTAGIKIRSAVAPLLKSKIELGENVTENVIIWE